MWSFATVHEVASRKAAHEGERASKEKRMWYKSQRIKRHKKRKIANIFKMMGLVHHHAMADKYM
jgi:hypothetical protein